MSLHQEHDKILEEVLAEFRSRGYKVIHLNRKPIFDAIAVKDNHTIGIEVTSSKLKDKIYRRKLKYKQFGFETDDLIIIGKNLPSVFKIPAEVYYFVLEMVKKGYKYNAIIEEVRKKFSVKISPAAISLWVSGKTKPLSVRNLEGFRKRNFVY